ncbi:MAG: PAS domain S-box protein, partial [Mariprofundaceae bacterium]|nr:PAS domain S-box protein [Mariprofundaceae bacterium]
VSYEAFLDSVHPHDREAVDTAYRESLVTKEPFNIEHRLLMSDGRIKWVQERCETRYGEDGKPVRSMGTVLDVTPRREQEAQLRLLESAVSAVRESIIITDANGIIVYVNPSFTRNTGFQAEDAMGKTPAILNSKQQSKGFYKQFWATLKAGEPWSGRILDRKKDGTIFPVHLSVAPIFDGRGEITHFVAVHEDLSHAEALQKKMAQAQKMEAVGTLVGGVAHDFNNMLASMVGGFYLVRMQYPDDEQLQQRIAAMEKAAVHGADLIRQMLTFARKDLTDRRNLNLCSFIKEAHKLAEASMPENIRLDLDISNAEHVCVKADATQLQQVLLNLVTNARHAVQDIVGSDGQGRILIEVDSRQPPTELLQEHTEMIADDQWCCIRCVDNGCGIKPETMEHIFEPFFTTKEVGKGTGLGLAMVYGAVQNHHGLIDITSAPGDGTTVSIWLPQDSAEVASVIDEIAMDVDGGGSVILLVDDEVSLRKVLVEVLQQNGFFVLE